MTEAQSHAEAMNLFMALTCFQYQFTQSQTDDLIQIIPFYFR